MSKISDKDKNVIYKFTLTLLLLLGLDRLMLIALNCSNSTIRFLNIIAIIIGILLLNVGFTILLMMNDDREDNIF